MVQSSPIRDARYYFSDGVVVLLCQGVLYKLHKTRLSMKSEFFLDLFKFPQNTSTTVVDGQDDDHPLRLDDSGIQNVDFRHLLVFLYDQDEIVAPAALQFHLSVLKLSMLWRIPSGIKYVKQQLPSHPEFTPAIQIQLSRQYDIIDWAGPAFRDLIEQPLDDIKLADSKHMGIVAFYKLIQVKHRVADYKVAMAFHPPDVHHSFGCDDENACSRLWESFWWGGFAKQLLHPNNKKKPAEILLELNPNKGVLSHMHPTCLQYTMEGIWENNPFNDEQEFMDEALIDLSSWIISL
ncbi:hypothetical protein DFH07DRAFT_738230 [Mycena maculata]|uniref:BTB domain-containing protein n=1 Tax=Mycena maculata TaxID=230809 RepID=A0AAD7NJK9_9AGAR|nr:hypothetical protein DFH07DRAFT_738230 [Mycena maculata]